jgi:tRNA1(Val) A37 N6-methylase TrmN6
VRHGDFRWESLAAGWEALPLVTGTPPYLPVAAATCSRHAQRAHCRLELAGGVEDYVQSAARLLGPHGRFVMCAAARQHARVEAAAAAVGLSVHRRLDVIPRAGKAPLLSVHVLARGAAARRHEPALVVRDAHGRRTSAMQALRADFGMPP